MAEQLKRYKAELWCRITAFHDLIVEASSPGEAKEIALRDAKQLTKHDWDLGEIEEIDLNTIGLPVEVAEDTE